MNQSRIKVTPLAEDETEQVVSVRVIFISAQSFRELLLGLIQIATGGSFAAALIQVVSRACQDGARLTRRRTLLLYRNAERVIAFPQLRIDL